MLSHLWTLLYHFNVSEVSVPDIVISSRTSHYLQYPVFFLISLLLIRLEKLKKPVLHLHVEFFVTNGSLQCSFFSWFDFSLVVLAACIIVWLEVFLIQLFCFDNIFIIIIGNTFLLFKFCLFFLLNMELSLPGLLFFLFIFWIFFGCI